MKPKLYIIKWPWYFGFCGFLIFGLIGGQIFGKGGNDVSSYEKRVIEKFDLKADTGKPVTEWKVITDKVMGGVSEGRIEMIEKDGRSTMRMTGDVYLKNNGGFILARTDLAGFGKVFNATEYDGVYLKVKGNGRKYEIHIRTKSTWLPWQFYQAGFQTDMTWQEIIIPFSKFKPCGLKAAFDKTRLRKISIAAAGREFRADIYLDEIGFYIDDMPAQTAGNDKNNFAKEPVKMRAEKPSDKPTEPVTQKMQTQPAVPVEKKRAIFASGCFWGVEYHFKKLEGVISTTAGYIGGTVENPTYKQVCTGRTGHAEAVEIVYDPAKTGYEDLVRLYFETHDFTQLNRQGPDVGTQYRSAIFYADDQQKEIAKKYIEILRHKGYGVTTQLSPAKTFYPAEDYHQDYYAKTGKTPYCHIYKKIF